MNASIDLYLVSERVLVLFFTMFAGIAARRLNIIDDATTKKLSKLLVNITQPLMIITSFQIMYDAKLLFDGFRIVVASVIIHVLAAAFAFIAFFKLKKLSERIIFEFGVIFANCSFIGYPVLKAVFGDEIAVFYGSFYIIFFNMFIWTWGLHILRRGKSGIKVPKWKIFINAGTLPCVIGVAVYLTQIKLPSPLFSAMKLVGDMTFPLSMIIVGSLIAHIKILKVLTNPRMYYFLAVRCFIFPCLILALCLLLRIDRTLGYLCVIMTAMPSGANTAIFSELYEADSKLGAESVGASTLVSVLSIPCIIMLLNFFYK